MSHTTLEPASDSLFDFLAAEQAKDAGMNTAEANAPTGFRAHALAAIEHVARMHLDFTTDEVIAVLAHRSQLEDVNLAALGPAMMAAARSGLIVNTGQRRKTKIPKRHRKLDVWRAA